MNLAIRKCLERDLEGVNQIERVSFAQSYDPLTFYFYLQTNPDGFLVAQGNSSAVGYAIGGVKERKGVVISLAVNPKFRRRGIGGALLGSILDYLANFTAAVEVQVRVSNHAALAFYTKSGFKVKGYIGGYYSNGEDALVMGLNLLEKNAFKIRGRY